MAEVDRTRTSIRATIRTLAMEWARVGSKLATRCMVVVHVALFSHTTSSRSRSHSSHITVDKTRSSTRENKMADGTMTMISISPRRAGVVEAVGAEEAGVAITTGAVEAATKTSN